jgi:hypothetical protein
VTGGAFPSADEARLVARQVAISQYAARQELAAGARLLADLFEQARGRLGAENPVTLRIEVRLLEARARTGQATQMAEEFSQFAQRCGKVLGRSHEVALRARMNAAQWQRKSGAVDRGIASYRQEVRLREAALGEEAMPTCLARLNLAVALLDRRGPRDVVDALELAEREVDGRTDNPRIGPEHAFTWVAVAVRVNALLAMAEDETDDDARRRLALQAEKAAADLAARRRRRLGPRADLTLRAFRARARALILLDECERAVWLLRRVQAGERAGSPLDPGRTDYLLARALSRTGRRDDLPVARELAARALVKLSEHTNPASVNARQAAALVAELASVPDGPPEAP